MKTRGTFSKNFNKFNNAKIIEFVKIKLKILKAFDQNPLKLKLKVFCLIFQCRSETEVIKSL